MSDFSRHHAQTFTLSGHGSTGDAVGTGGGTGPDIDPATEPSDPVPPREDVPSAASNVPYGADENAMDVLDAIDDTDESPPLAGGRNDRFEVDVMDDETFDVEEADAEDVPDASDTINDNVTVATVNAATGEAGRDGLTEHPDGSAPPLTRLVEQSPDATTPLDELIQRAPSERRT